MLNPRKKSSSSCNKNKEQGIHEQEEFELGIPNSSTLEKNTVETPKVEALEIEQEVVTLEVDKNRYSIATHRSRRQIQKPKSYKYYVAFSFSASQETEDIREP